MNRQTVIINQSLASSANFNINLRTLGLTFQPTRMIVRSLLYCNIAGTDSGTYLIWSSLTGGNIGAVYLGIQGVALTPQSEFPITANAQNADFRVLPGHVSYAGPSGLLTLTLEFIRD